MSLKEDAPPHMWGYWSEKHGLRVALEEYFPGALAQDLRLQMALHNIASAELTIRSVMAERTGDAEDV